MSIIVEYNNGNLVRFEKLSSKDVPSPIFIDEKAKFVCSGEVFEEAYTNIMNLDWEKKPQLLNTITGNIAVMKAELTFCNFAIDINGIDPFYYYKKDGRFLISDQFWEVVKETLPKISDINKDFVRKAIFEGGSQEGETIISDIKVLMPSQRGHYDATKDELLVEFYDDFRYDNSCKDVDLAVEVMDKMLHDAMKCIKKTCGDVKYGVGISGGLDSRIISHYAKANSMDVCGFNICVSRPHKLFLARSIKNAYQLAKVFNIPYTNVEWKKEKIYEKIKFSIKQNPLFSGNAFKYETKNLPEFEVLLTGGSGLVVGSMVPLDIEKQTEKMLVESIYQLFASYSSTSFTDRFWRAVQFLFGCKTKNRNYSVKSWFGMNLCGEDYEKKVYKRIENFVKERIKKGYSNMDIFMDYFQNVCGYQNRNGAFESLLATKRSFSIYVPFMLKETLKWSPELLLNRKVLNELIIQKVPEVADIKSESFFVAPGKRNSSIVAKVASMVEFVIRGNGTAIDQYYFKKKSVRKEFLDYINKDYQDWFHVIFDMESITVKEKDIKNEPVRILARVWELKALIECMEKKEYLFF